MRKLTQALSFALLVCLFFVAGTSAFASHLRGTTLNWQPTGTTGTVQFTVQYSRRASASCDQGTCAVGSTASFNFYYGDGNSDYIAATVTSVNSAEDYFTSVATFTHTYASAGPFIAYYEECCRVSAIQSGSGDTIRMETTVNPFASPVNHPPVVSMPAIITVPLQATTGFTVNAADQDHDTLHFRLATAQEMFDSTPFSCSMQQPPGLSINNNGVVTWNTTQITSSGCGYTAPASGDLWTAQFVVEDIDANNNVKSKTPLDVILKFVASTEAPPTLTFSNPGPITVAPGVPISFTVAGDDITANARVTLNATGLPLGATASNTNQSLIPTVTSTFNWTPTLAQAGTYVITYSATNDTMEQVLGSVTITVLNILPPSLTCSVSLTAQYNQSLAIPLQLTDPQGDAVTVVWSVDGSVVRTDSVPASTTASSLTLSQSFTTLGAHVVSVSATNSDGISSSCSTPVVVSKADQTITFGGLANMTYGDTDAVLTASSTSGDAVSFSATGSCAIINGALHATGAGSCSVTATQAGDANYNAATPVTQQLTIAPKALSVTAANATRTYGLANPTFTGTIVGIANNDAITATYSTTATQASLVGSYPIVPTLSGSALSNYTVTSTNGTLTITPGAPVKVVATVPPATLTAGGNVGSLVATIEDAGGNTVTASSAPVTAVILGPNGYSQSVTVNAVNGVATLNMSSLALNTAGTYTVATSSPGLTGTTSIVTVTPGPAAKVALGTLPTGLVSGGNLGTVTATIQDAQGNTIPSSSAAVTVTITGPNGYSQTLTVTAVNGVASLNLGALSLKAAGTYSITASSNGLTSSSTTFVVAPAAAAQLANSNVSPTVTSGSNLGTITSTVQDTNGNTVTSSSAVVTATITGPNGYSQTVTSAAVHGVAGIDLSGLKLTTVGTYSVTSTSNGLTAATSTVLVTPGAAASLALGTLPANITSGQSLGVLTASVLDAHGNVVTGSSAQVTVTLTGPNGFSQTLTGTVVNGVLTLDLSSFNPTTAGTYTLSVSSAGLPTATATINVGFASQSITLPALPNTTFGVSPVSLPATSSAGLPISYTITGPAVLQGSSLVVTGAGAVSVTATQAGDVAHSPVTVNKGFSVAQAASVAVLSPNQNVLVLGGSVGLSAQISSPAGTPTGTVTFLNGTTVLGTVAVNASGNATLTTTSLPTGALKLTAAYSGDMNYLSSLSPAAAVVVQDFSLTAINSTAPPVVPGASASYSLALTPQATGFSSVITLTASGLPPGATYSFTPATVTPGSAVANSVLTVQTARPVAAVRGFGEAGGITAALLLLPFGASRRMRRKLQNVRVLSLLGVLALLGGITGLTGCGSSNGFLGQPEKSYTVTVTATSGNLVHTTTVVVDLQ